MTTHEINEKSIMPDAQKITASAIEAMKKDLQHRWTVEKLARSSYCSMSTLNKAFHQVYGIGPGEYLSGLRYEEAARLLRTTSKSLPVICDFVGFSSPGTFCGKFRRLYGMTPSQYRKTALPA